jgi:hypothetical protein
MDLRWDTLEVIGAKRLNLDMKAYQECIDARQSDLRGQFMTIPGLAGVVGEGLTLHDTIVTKRGTRIACILGRIIKRDIFAIDDAPEFPERTTYSGAKDIARGFGNALEWLALFDERELLNADEREPLDDNGTTIMTIDPVDYEISSLFLAEEGFNIDIKNLPFAEIPTSLRSEKHPAAMLQVLKSVRFQEGAITNEVLLAFVSKSAAGLDR